MSKDLLKAERLAIVCDSFSECHAIYINGVLRGEYDHEELRPKDIFECYRDFANSPVNIVYHEVDSKSLNIFDETWGVPDWPGAISELGICN